jgi:hypothetical protein
LGFMAQPKHAIREYDTIFDMCRSIKQLRIADLKATDEEIKAAALQFVRKVSGYRKPSRANQAVFDKAVAEIALATKGLLDNIGNAGNAHDEAAAPSRHASST